MANCKNCEDIQHKRDGTAPERQEYIQPTMYDHLPSFCSYKQKTDVDREIEDKKKELVSLDQNFTNLKLIDNCKLEDCLCHFSTQKLTKFRNSLKDNSSSFLREVEDYKANEYSEAGISTTLNSSINISRSPINCPVSVCSATVGITSLLSHLFRDHCVSIGTDFEDIEGEQRSVLSFDHNGINFNENICLGVLAYGGKNEKEESRPGAKGFSLPNAFLPAKYGSFKNHLPILVMGCKTSIASYFKDKSLIDKYEDPQDKSKEILILWLAATETTKAVYGTFTAFNVDRSSSKSAMIKVRSLKDSQSPKQFVSKESNFLMLTRGTIDILSDNDKSPIEIEIFVHEFD